MSSSEFYAEKLGLGKEAPKPDPSITCAACKFFRLSHPALPEEWQTGNHGLCECPGQPPGVQHKDSVRCASFERYDKRDEAILIENKPTSSRMFK